MAGLAAHPQKTVFQPATSEKFLKFPLYIARQFPALLCHERSERRVILVNYLIEQGLLGPVTLERPASRSRLAILAATWGMIRFLALLSFR